jgi:tetratricopeptide (TPR) repeat protein
MSLRETVGRLLRRWQQNPTLTAEELCQPLQDQPGHADLLDAVRSGLHVLQATTLCGHKGDDEPESPQTPPPPRGRTAPPEAVPSGAAPKSRYRPLAFHARGGLGEVFRAEDVELHRQVALKRLQECHQAHVESRERFRQEAEITARLQHPGIVPVHGLEHDVDGRPCYAMRFIEGGTLDEALARFHRADTKPGRDAGERRRSMRELLGRFVAVCNTVAYAHSQGIVHRDLKPGNILLGDYGETLVVDWGLAKSTARTEAEPGPRVARSLPVGEGGSGEGTEVGQVLGTPAYLSPEQAAGRWDLVGPASDVFGLGATLYALLTGQVPFRGRDLDETLLKARRGEFPRPRQVNRQVPPALEAICLKAMALAPEARYPSARDLAADVEQWLADEPVTAYREPLVARLGRWARRHKPLVAGAVALLLAVVAALAVGLVVVKQEQRQTEQQRQAAVAARQQADEQSRLALDTLQSVLFDFQKKLDNVPAAHGLRREMLQTAIAGLEKVAASAARDPERGHGLVAAHLEIGDLLMVVGGTEPGRWTEEARRHYQAAHDLAETLAAAEPVQVDAQRDLEACHERLGDVLLRQGDARGARAAYQRSRAISQRLAAANPDSTRSQRDDSVCADKLGDVLLQLGDVRGARDAYQESLAIRQRLAAADPASVEAQRDLVFSHQNLGKVLQELGDGRGARDACRKALDISQQLAAADPSSARAQRDLATSYDQLGNVLLRAGDVQGARDAAEKGLQVSERLVKSDPGNALAQRDLAMSWGRVGDALQQLGNAAGARDAYQKCGEISAALAQADPASALAQRDLAIAEGRVGDALQQLGDMPGARAAYEKCLADRQHLADADPASAEAQRDLAAAQMQVADVLLRLGDIPAASKACRKGRDIRQRLAEADPSSGRAQGDLAIAAGKLGDVLQRLGDIRGARTAYQQVQAILERAAQADAANLRTQDALATAHERAGDVQRQLDDVAGARELYARCLAIRQRLTEARPNDFGAQDALVTSYYKLGRCDEADFQFGRAVEQYDRALALLSRLPAGTKGADQPRQAERRHDLEQALARCQAAERAVADLEFALRQPPEQVPQFLDLRVRALCRQGKHVDAAGTADRVRQLAGKNADRLYDAACYYALCSAAIAAGQPDERLPAADRSLRDRYVTRALGVLREAIQAGFNKLAPLKGDHDLDPLRPRDDFRKLVAELEARAGDR